RLSAEGPAQLLAARRASVVDHVRALLAFPPAGSEVLVNGNLIRTQAQVGGVEYAADIKIFAEAFLRPVFAGAIGQFRWLALSGNPEDLRKIDARILEMFPDNRIVTTGSGWRASMSPSRVFLPASPGWGMASAPSWRGRSTRWWLRANWRVPLPSAATTSTPAPWRIPIS